MVYFTSLARKKIKSILDFLWSGVKLPIWFSTLLLTITCVSDSKWVIILDIYVLIAFPWYKKFFNPMGFDPCNHSLKIWESVKTLTPKLGVHLEMWFPGFPLGPQPCNPCLGCEPKVATFDVHVNLHHAKTQFICFYGKILKNITSILYLNVHEVYKNKKTNGDDQIWRWCDNKWGIKLPPTTINMPPLPFEQFHMLFYQYPSLLQQCSYLLEFPQYLSSKLIYL
jgi:hypothetical protein